jgi:hypothetical protein
MTTDMDVATLRAGERGLKVHWELDNENWGRYMETRFYTKAFEYCPADG